MVVSGPDRCWHVGGLPDAVAERGRAASTEADTATAAATAERPLAE